MELLQVVGTSDDEATFTNSKEHDSSLHTYELDLR